MEEKEKLTDARLKTAISLAIIGIALLLILGALLLVAVLPGGIALGLAAICGALIATYGAYSVSRTRKRLMHK